MNKTPTTENNVKTEVSFWDKYHQVICFFAAIVICCGIYGYAVYQQNQKLSEGQQKIISTFEKHIVKANDSKYNHFPLPEIIKQKQEQEERENAYEEIKSLLDLEFNKIQNEFEAFEIWAGILTIIFLIFSFYSFFKTEQLEQQGKTALRLINETQTKSDELLKTLEKEKTEKLNAIDSSYKVWSRMKGDSIKKLLVKKSQEYQAQLSEDYKSEYDKKILEITDGINQKVSDTLAKSEIVSGDELKKFHDDWNEVFEQLKNDFIKWKNDNIATEADIDQIFEDEPEDPEDDEATDDGLPMKPIDDDKE